MKKKKKKKMKKNKKRHENGEWRRLPNEELHSLYRSPNIVRMVKFRILGWLGYEVRNEIR